MAVADRTSAERFRHSVGHGEGVRRGGMKILHSSGVPHKFVDISWFRHSVGTNVVVYIPWF
jgi:hypothetical protein